MLASLADEEEARRSVLTEKARRRAENEAKRHRLQLEKDNAGMSLQFNSVTSQTTYLTPWPGIVPTRCLQNAHDLQWKLITW